MGKSRKRTGQRAVVCPKEKEKLGDEKRAQGKWKGAVTEYEESIKQCQSRCRLLSEYSKSVVPCCGKCSRPSRKIACLYALLAVGPEGRDLPAIDWSKADDVTSGWLDEFEAHLCEETCEKIKLADSRVKRTEMIAYSKAAEHGRNVMKKRIAKDSNDKGDDSYSGGGGHADLDRKIPAKVDRLVSNGGGNDSNGRSGGGGHVDLKIPGKVGRLDSNDGSGGGGGHAGLDRKMPAKVDRFGWIATKTSKNYSLGPGEFGIVCCIPNCDAMFTSNGTTLKKQANMEISELQFSLSPNIIDNMWKKSNGPFRSMNCYRKMKVHYENHHPGEPLPPLFTLPTKLSANSAAAKRQGNVEVDDERRDGIGLGVSPSSPRRTLRKKAPPVANPRMRQENINERGRLQSGVANDASPQQVTWLKTPPLAPKEQQQQQHQENAAGHTPSGSRPSMVSDVETYSSSSQNGFPSLIPTGRLGSGKNDNDVGKARSPDLHQAIPNPNNRQLEQTPKQKQQQPKPEKGHGRRQSVIDLTCSPPPSPPCNMVQRTPPLAEELRQQQQWQKRENLELRARIDELARILDDLGAIRSMEHMVPPAKASTTSTIPPSPVTTRNNNNNGSSIDSIDNDKKDTSTSIPSKPPPTKKQRVSTTATMTTTALPTSQSEHRSSCFGGDNDLQQSRKRERAGSSGDMSACELPANKKQRVVPSSTNRHSWSLFSFWPFSTSDSSSSNSSQPSTSRNNYPSVLDPPLSSNPTDDSSKAQETYKSPGGAEMEVSSTDDDDILLDDVEPTKEDQDRKKAAVEGGPHNEDNDHDSCDDEVANSMGKYMLI